MEDNKVVIHKEATNQGYNNDNLKDRVKKKRTPPKQTEKLAGGKIQTTFNGGDLAPISYQIINAGDKILRSSFSGMIRVLAPAVPATDTLTARFRVGFIPMSHIVENYDAIKANTTEAGVDRDTNLPWTTTSNVTSNWVSSRPAGPARYQDTGAWKSKVASVFLPNLVKPNMPFSVLPIRAYHEFRNAFCRNKMYMPPTTQFKSQYVSTSERDLIVGTWTNVGDVWTPNIGLGSLGAYGSIAKDVVRNNYYSNVRNQYMQGGFIAGTGGAGVGVGEVIGESSVWSHAENDFTRMRVTNNATPANEQVSAIIEAYGREINDAPTAGNVNSSRFLLDQMRHADWEMLIAEYRRQIEDAEKNDWEIIAEMGGTTAVRTDRPALLGEFEVPLNYQQITQTAPDPSNESALGSTGAYSFTLCEGKNFFNHREFQQDGVLIYTCTVQSDNTFEEAVHRTMFIDNINDLWNPELAKIQKDVLLVEEVNACSSNTGLQRIQGYKNRYTEYSTLPNITAGDTRSKQLVINQQGQTIGSLAHWHNTKSLPEGLYLIDAAHFIDETQEVIARNSLTTGLRFMSEDQILLSGRLNVTMEKHATQEITAFGQEK
ncbi:major capsid protein [Tortoise microvirus 20]|nr:major capsid protein [Tortoise microvirus 20]